jgi:hypothetical protein
MERAAPALSSLVFHPIAAWLARETCTILAHFIPQPTAEHIKCAARRIIEADDPDALIQLLRGTRAIGGINYNEIVYTFIRVSAPNCTFHDIVGIYELGAYGDMMIISGVAAETTLSGFSNALYHVCHAPMPKSNFLSEAARKYTPLGQFEHFVRGCWALLQMARSNEPDPCDLQHVHMCSAYMMVVASMMSRNKAILDLCVQHNKGSMTYRAIVELLAQNDDAELLEWLVDDLDEPLKDILGTLIAYRAIKCLDMYHRRSPIDDIVRDRRVPPGCYPWMKANIPGYTLPIYIYDPWRYTALDVDVVWREGLEILPQIVDKIKLGEGRRHAHRLLYH